MRHHEHCLLQVGGLLSWKGTVTRTTEVRPELYLAAYKCKACGELVRNIEQQFVLTYPMMCPAAGCNNKSHWALVKEESKFVDWQRAKVQENADEVLLKLTVHIMIGLPVHESGTD
jgi:DNA replication licensing factor MCM6